MSENPTLRSLFLNVYMEANTDKVSAEVTISTDPQGNCTAAIHLTEEWHYLSVAQTLQKANLSFTFREGDDGMVFTADLGAVELYEADAVIASAFNNKRCSLTEHQFALSADSAQPELGITVLGDQMLSVRQTLASGAQFFDAERWSTYATVLLAAKADHDDRLSRYERVDLEDGEAVEVTFYDNVGLAAMMELVNQFPA